MKLQVLLATMNQADHSVLDSINLKTSAVVVNQSDEFKYETLKHEGEDILFMTLPERGVGLSRNTSLMRADADIVLFADENVVYDDKYEDVVLGAFREMPHADMIVFNVPIDDPERKTYTISRRHRVRRYNSLRYGAVRMAVRLSAIKKAGLSFSLLFGGGAKYSSGEDSIFIYQAIARGLKVYAVPESIGRVRVHESTWFKGYTDRFFQDKGALFRALSPRLHSLLSLQFVLRKKRLMSEGRSTAAMLSLMKKGADEYGH